MTKVEWLYGDAGDKWPVAVGDIWKLGDHVLGCGDLELGMPEALFAEFGLPNLTYVDPPWNTGNIKSFRTKAKLTSEDVDFKRFLEKLISLAGQVKGPAYIEMGRQNIDLLTELVEQSGGSVLDVWETVYYGKHPALLMRANWGSLASVAPPADFSGLGGDKVPLLAIQVDSKEGDTIFDPCAGLGTTCKVAHSTGRRFMGMELNPRRIANAIDWLAEQGLKPEIVKRGVAVD